MTASARDPGKMRLTHENLRVVRGDVLQPDTVDAAVAGQDAVVSALGTRPPLAILIATVVVCQIIVRTVALPRPAALFVELGGRLLAILLLSRRKTVISEGTRHILRAMEGAGIK